MGTVDSPLTRISLLIRLRNPADQVAWKEFVSIYGAVIYGFARKRGLQDADAADVMQDVLRSITSALPQLEYDPVKGRLRGWLYRVTKNRVLSFLTSRDHNHRATGDTGMQAMLTEHPDDSEGQTEWDQDFRKSLATQVLDEIRPEFNDRIYRAFWLTAVESRPVRDVSRDLGMTVGSVYVAKSRVLARVREIVQRRLEENGD